MDSNEKIKLLESELSQLNAELEKANTVLDQSVEASDLVDVGNPPKNEKETAGYLERVKIKKKLVEKVIANGLEELRLNSRLVRRISPTAGDMLDKRIKALENLERIMKKMVEEGFETGKIDLEELEIKQVDATSVLYETREITKLCRALIKDTIDKIRS